TAFTFGIFESALNPVALSLHLTQPEEGCINRGIGQGVFDRFHRFDLAPDDQMPATRLDFASGICSPGSSVQTRWSRCTSATKISFMSSSARRKAGSLP